MRPEDIPVVRNLPLFADMDDHRFDELVEVALLQTFPPQVDLIREGDPADFLYVLVEGAQIDWFNWASDGVGIVAGSSKQGI